MAQQSFVGQGVLFIEASRSFSYTTIDRTTLDEWSVRRRDNRPQSQETRHPWARRNSDPQS